MPEKYRVICPICLGPTGSTEPDLDRVRTFSFGTNEDEMVFDIFCIVCPAHKDVSTTDIRRIFYRAVYQFKESEESCIKIEPTDDQVTPDVVHA